MFPSPASEAAMAPVDYRDSSVIDHRMVAACVAVVFSRYESTRRGRSSPRSHATGSSLRRSCARWAPSSFLIGVAFTRAPINRAICCHSSVISSRLPGGSDESGGTEVEDYSHTA